MTVGTAIIKPIRMPVAGPPDEARAGKGRTSRAAACVEKGTNEAAQPDISVTRSI
jgi:hypothetical protein